MDKVYNNLKKSAKKKGAITQQICVGISAFDNSPFEEKKAKKTVRKVEE